MSELQDVLSSHDDYEEISNEEYMDAWEGGRPLFDLVREHDNCRVFVDPVEEGDFVIEVSSCAGTEAHYRISPTNGIVDSLAALEQVGFEHFTPEPPQPGEGPFQAVFDAIEQAGEER